MGLVGCTVGNLVGFLAGVGVGCFVGFEVGSTVGLRVGSGVGSLEGFFVGIAVGFKLGKEVLGMCVGSEVVGDVDGDADGLAVGNGVGVSVSNITAALASHSCMICATGARSLFQVDPTSCPNACHSFIVLPQRHSRQLMKKPLCLLFLNINSAVLHTFCVDERQVYVGNVPPKKHELSSNVQFATARCVSNMSKQPHCCAACKPTITLLLAFKLYPLNFT